MHVMGDFFIMELRSDTMNKLISSALILILLFGCAQTNNPVNDEMMNHDNHEEVIEPLPDEEIPEETVEFPEVKLVEVFSDHEFIRPLYVAFHGNETFIIQQPGYITKIIDNQASTLLDIRDTVTSSGNEQGLLGFALDPDYANNGIYYINYTRGSETIISGIDQGDEKVLLRYGQPYSNHNGGHLDFGPDGYLYIASGDGGSGGDPHGHAQDVNSLLGKILRIDVSNMEGTVPPSNPFGNEVYAYGLRNPWRFSFDSEGTLYVADVGQNAIEEINIVENGKNYGWNIMEGTQSYSGEASSDYEPPIYEYDHSLGRSITGGYVYEGDRLPGLKGYYVYGDFVSGTIWAFKDNQNEVLIQSDLNIASFGRDQDNELYIVDLSGHIYQLQESE